MIYFANNDTKNDVNVNKNSYKYHKKSHLTMRRKVDYISCLEGKDNLLV